ncbi:MAC/perforin domain-containing protein [Pedobacter miscanthi]|uniref:MAC/perforin domain-containing protein n=1 Tax=Pedobacter miscanthi TaxID=2259170 RepID=UPI00292DF7E7|nr:MAC/perforin domain-containing protein [Pedobacter miscanthi]
MKNNYKLKIICLLCVLTAAFSSCKKNELAEEKTLTNRHNMQASAGDGVWDLLGYGYDVTGEYANSSASKFSVIDVVKLKADYFDRVEKDEASRKYGEVIGGENAASYLSNLTDKLGASASVPQGDIPKTTPADGKNLPIPLFKLSVTSSFDNTNAWSSKYVYSSYSLKIQQKRVKINAEAELLRQYLQPAFISDVQNSSPQQIVAKFGTHVLKDIILGAKLSVHYRAETNTTDRKEASTSGIDVNVLGIFGINTSQTSSTQQTTNNTNWKLVYETIGGEPSASLSGSATAGSAPSVSTTAWENSSSLNNAELIDFTKDGLIPIWDLIADPVKSAAVKAYVIQYLIDGQAKLNIEVASLYRYYNGTDHYYTTTSGNYPSYHLEGTEGYLYKYQETGTVPLYQYYNGTDHYYTTTNGSYSGYQFQGIVGYIYINQFPGTVPLYRYYNNTDHYYATASGNYPGYHYEGIAGYLYKTKP